MITNERQYAITKAQAAKFRAALEADPPENMHPKALKAMREGTQSQLDELEEQLAEYEALQSGKLAKIELSSLVDIGPALVKVRIARRLTHKALADRMNLAEQQIQRYEATGYAGVSIERLQAVVDALKVNVNEVLTLKND
jgi:DNA-binding Xre family transcriptional regulator